MSLNQETTLSSGFFQSDDSLNEQQRAAVNYDRGHLLIIAGPGTGKTHTLTRRIARLAADIPDGEQILAITFTNKAAEEMKSRLEAVATGLKRSSPFVFIGTFHQFCLQILRQYGEKSDLPAVFKVASVEECEQAAAGLWPDLKPGERKRQLEKISRYKSVGFEEDPPSEVVLYNRALREQRMVDFDDLLLEAVRLLQGDKKAQEQTRGIYRYIFVDEYQDINAVQRALLRILVGSKNSLTAIGDPNQAIYGFRGSDVRFFESFSKDFAGARVLSLSENYRSAVNLLAASGQVIGRLQDEGVPALTAKMYLDGHLVIHEAATDKAEAEYVVHQIERLVGGTSMFSQDSGRVETEQEGERSFGDIAVLYRLNSQRYALKTAFARSGIPFHVCGEDQDERDPTLEDDIFIQHQDTVDIQAEKVTLMTLHAAKGLEFPVVFMAGCEEGLLPLDMPGMKADLDEERRLFYVGMTRAKERLYLLSAKRRMLYGKTVTNKVSPFVTDIADDLKKVEAARSRPKKKAKDADQMKLF